MSVITTEFDTTALVALIDRFEGEALFTEDLRTATLLDVTSNPDQVATALADMAAEHLTEALEGRGTRHPALEAAATAVEDALYGDVEQDFLVAI